MKENQNQGNSFNTNQLFEHVKNFSFPRLAGTEGERTSVELTVTTFKEVGFNDEQIVKESFEFSDFYATTLIKLIVAINLTFSFTLLLFAYIYPIITIAVIAIMTIIVLLIFRGLKHPENPGFWGKYYGEFFSATNVFAKVPAKQINEKEVGNIIISAHLDSKSQNLKTRWRVYSYGTWLYSGIILGGFFITFLVDVFTPIDIDIIIHAIGIWIPTFLIAFSNVMLMLLNTGNSSPGSLDNASGMAIIFELSRSFIYHPLNNFNLWFCQFSAEELGTMGSRFFVKNHGNLFVKGNVFQINCDMVSCATFKKKNRVQYLKSYGVFPRKKIAPILGKYLHEGAKKENLKIDGFHVSTGAHTDTVSFHQRGFNAVDISTRAAAKWTHNKDDTPDKVDPQVLRNACLIIKRAILLLDEDHEKFIKSAITTNEGV